MCYYELSICAYPHRDAISSLIFDPHKNQKWVECDLPKPWGRMSCGNLIVHHSILHENSPNDQLYALSPCSNISRNMTNNPNQQDAVSDELPKFKTIMVRNSVASIDSEVSIFPCEWCTTALKVVATKAKYLQKDARDKLDALEESMNHDPTVRKLYNEVAKKEAELLELRYKAWKSVITGVQECSEDNSSGKKENSIILES